MLSLTTFGSRLLTFQGLFSAGAAQTFVGFWILHSLAFGAWHSRVRVCSDLFCLFQLSVSIKSAAHPDMWVTFMRKESESEVVQSCPTLCDPMDYSLPGSSVHGIFQARVLEWVAMPFSRGSSPPRDWNWVSRIVGRHFTVATVVIFFLLSLMTVPKENKIMELKEEKRMAKEREPWGIKLWLGNPGVPTTRVSCRHRASSTWVGVAAHTPLALHPTESAFFSKIKVV